MDTAFFSTFTTTFKGIFASTTKSTGQKAGAFSEMPKKQFAKYAFVFVGMDVFIYFRNGAVR